MSAAERLRAALGWKPVARPRRPVLFVNPRSGGGTAVRLALPERARELGIEPIVLEPDHDLAALVADAVDRGADALGMAGGDGSMAAVAAAAFAHDLPFACVPAGTRNHFARDLGVERGDVVGALEAFTDGLERRIDVGEVNGSVFVDNVILGFYGEAVRQEGYRDARLQTLLTTAQAALGPRAPASGLAIVDDRGAEHREPAVVMVSNNPYAVDRKVAVETRPRLDTGRLGVLVLDRPPARPAERAWAATAVEVTAAGEVHAGRDGEAALLVAPMRFAIRPLALRVRICARHPGASPSAQLASLDPRRGTPPGLSRRGRR
jgi:diacylglycerol kinase family enzyme